MRHFSTVVTAVSPEARELIAGGVLILFAEGAPPELAEVSVLHRIATPPAAEAPAAGAIFTIAGMATRITAIGDKAWAKVADMGHVVINFNGASAAPRPGEISVMPVDVVALADELSPGAVIVIDA
jgi:glucitol/sorbitol PTS system EIIA component